jgi:hypothetical protein
MAIQSSPNFLKVWPRRDTSLALAVFHIGEATESIVFQLDQVIFGVEGLGSAGEPHGTEV